MAYLIPDNLGSRSDVPAGIQQVAKAFREFTGEDVTVLWDPVAPEDSLEIIDPRAGVLILDIVTGGARALPSAGRGGLARWFKSDGDEPDLREALTSQAQRLAERLQESGQLTTEFPVQVARAIPAAGADQIRQRGHDPARLLTKDDFRKEALRSAVSRLLGGEVSPLKEKEERAVRAAVTPEIVIRQAPRKESTESGQLVFQAPETDNDEDALAVLDRQQQNLAMHLGDGYRVIRGVAGSGKSLVLTHRARLLAERLANAQILLTCFNIVIGRALAHQLRDLPNVHVRHIDSLAHEVARAARTMPPSPSQRPGQEHYDRVREAAVRAQKNHQSPWKYDVVLVDEGQDFDNNAFDLASYSLKEGRSDFIVALDAAQNIFRKRARWNPPGITARGRSTIMRVNYRNTKEILEVAYRVLAHSAEPGQEEGGLAPDLDDPTVVVHPESTARRGEWPRVVQAGSVRDEIGAVCDQLISWNRQGVPWSDMLVLFGSNKHQKQLYYESARRGIPYYCVSFNQKNKREVMNAADVVRSSNLYTIKGLEVGHVALCGVNDIYSGVGDDDEIGQRRLLYVGMTRATDRLFVTVSGSGPIGNDVLKAGDATGESAAVYGERREEGPAHEARQYEKRSQKGRAGTTPDKATRTRGSSDRMGASQGGEGEVKEGSTGGTRESESEVKGAVEGPSEERVSSARLRSAILEALDALGGSARTRDVLDRVGEVLGGELSRSDIEMGLSGYPRWRSAAQAQRKQLIQEGFLRADSPTGTWELERSVTTSGAEKVSSSVFREAVVEALRDLGGSARAKDVVDRVGEVLADELGPLDTQVTATGEPRWRNAARAQRQYLIQEGLLRDDSPNGLWELTDQAYRR